MLQYATATCNNQKLLTLSGSQIHKCSQENTSQNSKAQPLKSVHFIGRKSFFSFGRTSFGCFILFRIELQEILWIYSAYKSMRIGF